MPARRLASRPAVLLRPMLLRPMLLGLLLFGSACGDGAGNTSPGPIDSAGIDSAGIDTASGTSPGPRISADTAPGNPSTAECAESFRDATTTETPEISIRNTGSVPLFVLTSDCPTGSSLVQVQRDGQPLDVQAPSPCSGASCEALLHPPPLQDKRGSACTCGPGPELHLLPPQQTLRQPVGLESVQRELPASCLQLLSDAIPCVVQAHPAAGDYTLVVRAFLDPPCAPAQPPDAGISSPATSATGGPCTSAPDPSRSLTFTLPTDTYF